MSRRLGFRRGAASGAAPAAKVVDVGAEYPGGWSRRRRPRRNRARLRALAGLGLLTFLGALGYLFYGSSAFRASTVQVAGESRLSADAVRAAAAVADQVPLARLDTGSIDRRVSALPAVAAVDVRRHWPRTVRISVTERVPLLAVPATAGYTLIDRAGVGFATVPTAPRNLPVAAAASMRRSAATTQAVLGVVTALSPALRTALLRVEASSDSAVNLVLRDGRRVVWGGNDRTGLKAEVLAALLKRKGRVYDVSAPDVVTVAR